MCHIDPMRCLLWQIVHRLFSSSILPWFQKCPTNLLGFKLSLVTKKYAF